MTYHVVCLAGKDDHFTPDTVPGDQVLYAPFEYPDHPDALQSSVAQVFERYGVTPSHAAVDLLNAATAAYAADVRTSRSDTFDGWTRSFALHLAVRNAESWTAATSIFERLLGFLTGDRWTVDVHEAPESYEPLAFEEPMQLLKTLHTKTVALFSGGLDSFVGAIDEIERVGQVALVGHHSAGAGATSRAQSLALDSLRTTYSEEDTAFLQLWLSPPKGPERVSEITTRGRSIIFLGLGIAVADGIGADELVVPENGLISLNVPLTNARLGSFSTRTTHPYTMHLVREILSRLNIGVSIRLPYRFATKGEMLAHCSKPELLQGEITSTMSCSHPSASRFSNSDPNLHCGYCLPCLIRRAAITTVGADPTPYAITDLRTLTSGKRHSDMRALRLALDRYANHPPGLADVLTAGPLPVTDGERGEFLGVFRRGLAEAQAFLDAYR